mmetsp:Transcript_21602/g.34862  ORF Transcript_21602/g.34862 Transcript_21602/m.34862 type:complete len:205 (-) Transcript_21602:116-730(-)
MIAARRLRVVAFSPVCVLALAADSRGGSSGILLTGRFTVTASSLYARAASISVSKTPSIMFWPSKEIRESHSCPFLETPMYLDVLRPFFLPPGDLLGFFFPLARAIPFLRFGAEVRGLFFCFFPLEYSLTVRLSFLMPAHPSSFIPSSIEVISSSSDVEMPSSSSKNRSPLSLSPCPKSCFVFSLLARTPSFSARTSSDLPLTL